MKSFTALLALAAVVCAMPDNQRRQASSTVAMTSVTLDRQSILAILATALPTSLVNEAITNTEAVASEIASEFANNMTPAWFSALPSDVQSELIPLETLTVAPEVFLSALPTQATVLRNLTYVPLNTTTSRPPFPAGNSTGIRGSTVAVTTRSTMSSSGSTTGSGPANTGASSMSSTSTGMANLPTGIISGGLAGLVGMVGILAL